MKLTVFTKSLAFFIENLKLGGFVPVLGQTFMTITFFLFTISCAGMNQLQYSKIYSRAGWQLPEQVVETLKIKRGQIIADLGAGNGYFTKYLSREVGETGKVYAIEVEPDMVSKLRTKFSDHQPSNVQIILGNATNPNLPEKVDLIFSCNTYHHIENRSAYFSELKKLLKSEGRIAIIDHKDDLTGILRVLVTKDHWSSRETLIKEMKEAGLEEIDRFDFLPTQNFFLFQIRKQN
ncbi:methyltransferase domain-containing protein [Leptospira sp. 201903070]|uniref:Methyltransferase domain-containing protein n=1 Tax=Leptospira ainlahdjerensis TaxID=2810033 RepID=A0ABS2UIL8_9LEPT|nr:class I SAM-dependent methyltransferase [Leptospira ainlahdjerensis]MBM9579227.1 methyltransferase domain-containing protein [Leptospira ainlahdjerensis]